MKRILLLLGFTGVMSISAWAQRPLKTQATIDGFYSLPMARMLDTLSLKCQTRIIYEPEMLKDYMVTDRYLNESVKDVLGKICRDNKLYY